MNYPKPKLLLTRPRETSEALLADLPGDISDRVLVTISPLFDIVPTGVKPDLTDMRGVIFTSAQGVVHGGAAAEIPAYCVGARTTMMANKAGWTARQCGTSADGLVADLLHNRPCGPLLHIGGVHKRGNIAGRLVKGGVAAQEISVYEQKLRPLSIEAREMFEQGAPVIVPLFSPRTARHFAQQNVANQNTHIIALSAQVMGELSQIPAATRQIAHSPDRAGMMEMIVKVARRVEAGRAAQ